MGMFTETPLFDDPSLPTGWYRKVVQRQTGATAGQWDVYVYNPEGKKFRSRNELRAYLTQIGSSLNSEDFDFSVKGKGHHNKDSQAGSAQASGVKDQKKQKAKAVQKTPQTPGDEKKVAFKRKFEKKKNDAEYAVGKKQNQLDFTLRKTSLAVNNSTVQLPPKFEPPLDLIPTQRDPRVATAWDPPRSPYRLVQEYLYKDPWKLLVATIFLNKTSGKAANPLIWEFFRRWPTPEDARKGSPREMTELISPLGLQELRAKRIIKMSENYIDKDWSYPSELYGISKYGEDSYRIFCLGRWRDVNPTDIMLKLYQDWLFTNSKALNLE